MSGSPKLVHAFGDGNFLFMDPGVDVEAHELVALPDDILDVLHDSNSEFAEDVGLQGKDPIYSCEVGVVARLLEVKDKVIKHIEKFTLLGLRQCFDDESVVD